MMKRGASFLQNMSTENLQRLTQRLIHPETNLTPALKTLADWMMDEIKA